MKPICILAAAAALLLGACTTPAPPASRPVSPAQAPPDEKCLALERAFTGMNSAEMGRLFGLAQDRYDGAMPCIGAAAKLRGDHPGSVCAVMPNPYQLDRVQEGAPAHRAGLKEGDLVESVGDRPVNFPMDFDAAVLGLRPGAFVAVKVKRGERHMTGQVRVGVMRPGDGSSCTVLAPR
jgi:hypothetical protein